MYLDALSIVMFHIASHSPDLFMQLLARMLESIADSKCQIRAAFVFRWSVLDVHFAAFREHEANVHLIKAAFAVMRTGRLYQDAAGRWRIKVATGWERKPRDEIERLLSAKETTESRGDVHDQAKDHCYRCNWKDG